MSILRKKKTALFESQYHIYQNDILADGFISPLCLPCERLKELMKETPSPTGEGAISLGEMADICHMEVESLQYLFDNEAAEPTPGQLSRIARTFRVSVLWLLGYHTIKEAHPGSRDSDILRELGKRNAIESQVRQCRERGNARAFFVGILQERLNKQMLLVSNTIARIVATEHIPLTDDELYMMLGQPVFLEPKNADVAWGICLPDNIVTASKTYPIELNGDLYKAFMTPDTAVSFLP